MINKITNHDWCEEDETIAFFCEKFGTNGLLVSSESELAESVIGTTKASLIMKRANFKHLMGNEGFEHYSINQVKVIEKYSTSSRDELKNIVNKIIDKRDLSTTKKEFAKKVKAKKNDKALIDILLKMGKDPKKMKRLSIN